MADLTLRVVEDPASLKADWNRLAAHAGDMSLFATYEWHATWFRRVAPDARPAVVAATSVADGTVVGLAPFCEGPYRDLGLRLPAVGFSGRDVVSGDYLDVLAEPDWHGRVVEATLGHLAGVLRTGRLVVLGEIVRGSDLDAAIQEWLERERLRFRVQEERVCPYLELPSSFDDYLKTRSRNTRSLIRRRIRQVGDAGCLVQRLEGDAILPHLPRFFELHRARWESIGQRGVFIRSGFQEFLHDLVATPPPGVVPILHALSEKNEVAAAFLVFHCGPTAVYYQAGWDPASKHARLSPGLVLMARAIDTAIEAGCTRFDFLRGGEDYKRKFTETFRHTYTLLVAGRSLRSRAYLAALRAKDAVKRLLGRGESDGAW
ncbi:MAG: GNAT family N-acetyltransferase [Planctomycetota bacterium]|jgi:CelD/BcsL family acetyltransferase involved in cellulose biosynthesis